MARLNTPRTHEGAPAPIETTDPLLQLRRSVLACMLWESEFYESGQKIADRIAALTCQVEPVRAAEVALEARNKQHIRHAPLLVLATLATRCRGQAHGLVRTLLPEICDRADQMGELLAIYAGLNKTSPDKLRGKLSAQLKRGLADAVLTFDDYALAKYDRDRKKVRVTLGDIIRLTHPRPVNDEQSAALKLAVGDAPATERRQAADTWERELSAGKDKRATFERMLEGGKLGYLALLRNLRGMAEAGVNPMLVDRAILARKGARRILPFQFITAWRHAPQHAAALEAALRAQLGETPVLPGLTGILVDVSGSMVGAKLSSKSELDRLDVASALAAVVPAERRFVWGFSYGIERVVYPTSEPPTPFAVIDKLRHLEHGGTNLGGAVRSALAENPDRLIVISDEQSADPVPLPTCRAYMINVASNEHGVGYGQGWAAHIDGWSDNVLRYIAEMEQLGGGGRAVMRRPAKSVEAGSTPAHLSA